jgi:hypothetical protein
VLLVATLIVEMTKKLFNMSIITFQSKNATESKVNSVSNLIQSGGYSNKRKPCPVCGSSTGKCKTVVKSQPVVYCYHHKHLRLKDVVDGYDGNKWIALAVSDLSATMAIYQPLSGDIIATTTKKVSKPIKKKVAPAANELNAKINELDSRYRELFGQLTLSEYGADEISRRLGITTGSDLASNQYYTVSAKTRVKLSHPLPGLIADGDVYRFPCHGYQQYLLIPIKIQGKCVGLQLRNTDKSAPNRYTFVSKDGDYRLWDEQPRHLDIRTGCNKVYVTEGYLKPQITAIKYDVSVIGAGRSWSSNSTNHTAILKQHLTPGSEVILCLDAGDIANTHVMPKWLDEYDYFSGLGYRVSFGLGANYETKAGDDIDELDSLDDLLILPKELLLEMHPELSPDADDDDDADDDLFSEFLPKSSSSFSQPPGIEVRSGYIGNTVDGSKLKIAQDIVVTGSCGSGKTQFIKQILHANRHLKHLSLAHLNNLGQTQAASFSAAGIYNLDHHTDLKNREIPLCDARYLVTSLVTALDPRKFNIAHFASDNSNRPEPYLLLIDEIAQLIEQLANFSPFKRDRLGAWERLCDIIRGAERIIVSDRAMTDEIYNWLVALRKRAPLVISHTGKKDLKNAINVVTSSSPAKLFDEVVAKAAGGKKLIIGFESKERAKQLELMLIRAGVTNLVNINADIDPEKKPIIKTIETTFADYQVLIYTKTLGTGVSLVGGGFNEKYMFFSGTVLTAEDMIQQLARYRDDVPTTVWIKNRKKERDITAGESCYGVIDGWQEKINQAASTRHYSGLILEMQQNGYLPEYKDANRFIDENKTWLGITSKIQERINATKAAPLLAFLWELKKDGIAYTVTSEPKDKLAEEKLKTIKQEIQINEANQVLDAPELDNTAYELYKHSPDAIKTTEQRNSYQKTKLIADTGWRDDDLTVDLVLKELDKHPLTAKMHQTAIDTRLTSDDLKWLDARQANRDARDVSNHQLRANFKNKLGLQKILDLARAGNFSWTGDSPALQDMVGVARENSGEFKQYIGLEITEKTKNSKIINAVIRTTGLEPEPVQSSTYRHQLTEHPLAHIKQKLEKILAGEEITGDAISAAILALEPHWSQYKQLTHKTSLDTLKAILAVYGWKMTNTRNNTYRIEKTELPLYPLTAGIISQETLDALTALAKQKKLPGARSRESEKITVSRLLGAMGWKLKTELAQKCNHGSRIYTLDAHTTQLVLDGIDNAPVKTLDSGYEKFCKWMATKATEPVQALADLMLLSHRAILMSDDDSSIQQHQSQLDQLISRCNQLPPTAKARLIDKLSANNELTKLIAS